MAISFITQNERADQKKTDLLVLPLFDGKIERNSTLERIDKQLAGLISQSLKIEEFKGSAGEFKTFHSHHKVKAKYVMVLGLGEAKKFEVETIRKATGKVVAVAEQLKAKDVSYTIVEATEDLCSPEAAVEAATEAFVLASYKFTTYKSKKGTSSLVQNVAYPLLSAKFSASCKQGIHRGQLIGNAANFTRDLVNTPSHDKPPELLAKHAQKTAGIRTRVFRARDLKRMGMGGIVGVGQGSMYPPVLVEMIYKPAGKAKKVVALVGKGVTFDSGGLSLKPPKSMETMKDDMAAAGAILGVMKTLKDIKPNVEVRAYIPSAENMPDSNAMRPGDVLKMYSGKTVEVLNTDAEGRLILADALAFACESKPDYIIDMATLTGACLVALGEQYSAIMGNNKELIHKVIEAGKSCGENIWELPLVEEYKDEMKSSVADIQNIGGPYGGTINGGLFLQEFVDPKIPWVHIDIAGPSWANKPHAYGPKGGTGVMVRTLCKFLKSF